MDADVSVPTTIPELAELCADLLQRIASHKIKVHCLTNTVAEPITANALLAVGAIPSMTSDQEEVPAFVRSADALLVNLGTPTPDKVAVRRLAAAIASEDGLPWVLDPVMAERASGRRLEAETLLQEGPSVLRCNSEEAVALMPHLHPFQGIVASTGGTDRIHSKSHAVELATGDPMLARVTATGCALSAIVAAFLAVSPEDPFGAALAAVACFGSAGALAAREARGPGSMAVALLDALAGLDRQAVESEIRRFDTTVKKELA